MIKEAMFYEKLGGNRVQCGLCSHRCKIDPGSFGVCGVRKNTGGRLDTLVYGEVIAAHVDPIEKKPIYHFLPGSYSYSIATVGCNFKCSFCQNWQISQASKMGEGWRVEGGGREMTPDEVVKEAKKADCRSISYTYTEPTIFFEYAYDTARLAKAAGLSNIFVTNGYMAGEALREISPYLDAANVDLKSFREDFYKEMCSAHLEPVLESIKTMKKLGIWVEITTLVVTGRNDSDEEFKDIAEFIVSVDPGIPWHISRFHPDFKYLDRAPTSVETLKRAREIGNKTGLEHIHLGNIIEA
ncbi:MAG: AmmeMemoRadiSam system radical SAM enzyme [Candidatus Omnitrophica bacterium]|nr:AmmeMemoRadiSam system radical SAM enzyme [Candidatus Omnitrophota bacterium]MBU4589429.1 AmmeMemoRadiSam system radical SAM enzyme [Candidatus Omnitrophota bacterium]